MNPSHTPASTMIAYLRELAAEPVRMVSGAPFSKFMRFMREHRGSCIAALLLLLGFSQIYFWIARHYMLAGILYPTDSLYGWDVPRVVDDMIERGSNQRSNVHPLFILFIKPAGLLLHEIAGFSKHTSAIILSASAMALGVSLSFVFFRLWRVRLPESVICACGYGFTMIGYFSGIVPETGVFAICALTLAMTLASLYLVRGARSEWLWIASGVFTYGITISNVVKNIAGHGFSGWSRGRTFAAAAWRTTIYAVITVATGAFLTWMIGSSFNLLADRWIATPELRQGNIENIARELFLNFLCYDIIGPAPSMQIVDFPPALIQLKVVTFNESSYSVFQWLIAGAWLAAFGASFVTAFLKRDETEVRMASTFLFMLVWDFLFFSRYYVPFEGLLHWSAHVIPAVFLPVVFLVRRTNGFSKGMRVATLAGMAGFVILMAVNNLGVVWKSLALWQG